MVPNGIVRFMYLKEFRDVFGDINYSPIICGTLMENPDLWVHPPSAPKIRNLNMWEICISQ